LAKFETLAEFVLERGAKPYGQIKNEGRKVAFERIKKG
jgi:hypothetical protein